jgi:Kef-type K+ transport system membrane component KefB
MSARCAVSFGTLALLVVAGLLGPALRALPRLAPPAVVGEIVAGLLIGANGMGWIDTKDPSLRLLADIGFAMLMFIVATHLPLRDPRLRPALARGAATAITTGGLAIGAGFALAPFVGLDRPAILAVLLATSSAAVVLPVIEATTRIDRPILVTMSWVAFADVGSVLAVPLVTSEGRLGRVVVGGLLVLLAAGGVYLVARSMTHRRVVHAARAASRAHGWGLDLRASILVLFTLAWIATRFGTSILIAGFAAGVVVSALGEPRRVAQQLIGLGEGFFVPIFFVDLGARLDLGALVREPRALGLGAAILVGSLAVHALAAVIWHLPVASGLVATAQLGVPAAVVSLGLAAGSITAAQAAAIMAAVLASLGICAFGAARLSADAARP